MYFLLDKKDALECMLPKVSLVLIRCHSTALFVTYFDNLSQNFIELLDRLIFAVHVLVNLIEKGWHQVDSNFDQNFSVELDSFVVLRVASVQNCAGLSSILFQTDFQTFLDWEVAARNKFNDLVAILAMTKDLHKL